MSADHTTASTAPARPKPTPRYDRILAEAQRVALDEGGDFVGVEHLMMAILDDGQSVATAALERLVTLEDVQAELRSIMDSEGYRAGR